MNDLGARLKIYYTVRELTTHCVELFALASLGDEILALDAGNSAVDSGDAWMVEHLAEPLGVGYNYTSAWFTLLEDGERDQAIADNGTSRWANYYLEGLRWLMEGDSESRSSRTGSQALGLDGLYLDGLAYDRVTMQRLRRTTDEARASDQDAALLDLHTGTSNYQLTSHFPYVGQPLPPSLSLSLS